MKAILLLPLFIIGMALALMTIPILPSYLIGSSQNLMLMTFIIIIPIMIGLVIFMRLYK